ncbi:response regulator [Candidatus Magnetaquicoccus inordinatus]|uniref:response regulator n=1 Tax=Candidatus Magnetaquicoccus inordinatus TaxID=2496818 RepID=UPI00187D571F|nr:response regulator [Candidatus Magnetaquicoccus inordinatus]
MKRILLVDDEEQMRHLLRLMLEDAGYEVGVATNGNEAIALWREQGPWDLLLCDILMPERDGIETIIAIHGENAQQVMIAMTGGGNYHILQVEELLGVAKMFGAKQVLRKPFSLHQLLNAVENAQKAA